MKIPDKSGREEKNSERFVPNPAGKLGGKREKRGKKGGKREEREFREQEKPR